MDPPPAALEQFSTASAFSLKNISSSLCSSTFSSVISPAGTEISACRAPAALSVCTTYVGPDKQGVVCQQEQSSARSLFLEVIFILGGPWKNTHPNQAFNLKVKELV